MWTRLPETDPAFYDAVKQRIDQSASALGLLYHNFDHVLSMYDYLERSGEPYSRELDIAVLGHDSVYDEKQFKEKRSSDFTVDTLAEMGISADLTLIDEMIMATENHLVTSPRVSAIVRADLHALTSIEKTVFNYFLIKKEACNIYKIDDAQFATASEAFMTKLSGTMSMNCNLDSKHSDFYLKAMRGAQLTAEMSKGILASK